MDLDNALQPDGGGGLYVVELFALVEVRVVELAVADWLVVVVVVEKEAVDELDVETVLTGIDLRMFAWMMIVWMVVELGTVDQSIVDSGVDGRNHDLGKIYCVFAASRN